MWLYQNKVIEKLEDFPSNTFGFVYKITHPETGQFYIGRKNLQLKKTKKIGKNRFKKEQHQGRYDCHFKS